MGGRTLYLGRSELAAEARVARKQAQEMELDEVKIRAAHDQFLAWRADKLAGKLPMVAPVDKAPRWAQGYG
jgi:hypothetical protein